VKSMKKGGRLICYYKREKQMPSPSGNLIQTEKRNADFVLSKKKKPEMAERAISSEQILTRIKRGRYREYAGARVVREESQPS